MNKLSEREAYDAMFAFLEHRYRLTASDELGALLGSMLLLPDGATADPAIWEDWLNALKNVAAHRVEVSMKLE